MGIFSSKQQRKQEIEAVVDAIVMERGGLRTESFEANLLWEQIANLKKYLLMEIPSALQSEIAKHAPALIKASQHAQADEITDRLSSIEDRSAAMVDKLETEQASK